VLRFLVGGNVATGQDDFLDDFGRDDLEDLDDFALFAWAC